MHLSAKFHRLTLALLLCATIAAAQQPTAGAARQRPPGRSAPAPDDNTGFESIFDSKSLTNWDGDPAFWRVENGAIVGETTAEKTLKQNTFIIWRGGKTADLRSGSSTRSPRSATAAFSIAARPCPMPVSGS
jgi:hypothetical protein